SGRQTFNAGRQFGPIPLEQSSVGIPTAAIARMGCSWRLFAKLPRRRAPRARNWGRAQMVPMRRGSIDDGANNFASPVGTQDLVAEEECDTEEELQHNGWEGGPFLSPGGSLPPLITPLEIPSTAVQNALDELLTDLH